ncbi:hypothetical protein GP486_003840 [Trichoglossum hirsutum]|uniref:Uncharacterized protein n=1 Tax=Trichoglossum hirsutum TaxID=265104 RepID=A0A9P8LC58_9PEZI|nr:hypothetical protein GP486_003840 [Trichoglossum hirsutum]
MALPEPLLQRAPTETPQSRGRGLAQRPLTRDELNSTPRTDHDTPAEHRSSAEMERDRLEFEAKHPEVIQASRQMNAALGIRRHKPFTLPFRPPNWDGKPRALIDSLEYYRSTQYGDTLYLNCVSFHDLTPDEENGFRTDRLLCHFEAEEMITLRASFVDLSAFGCGKWTYMVLGFKEGVCPSRPSPQLLSIACPVEKVQVVRCSAETWLDRDGRKS